jgi:hypothetical protein
MKHVSLDAQEEAVKRFVLALAVEVDGSVLELNGRPVACVMPVVPDGNGATGADDAWTEDQNARRCALIDKEIAGSLTATEAAELQQLQQQMLRHRRRVAPLPLDDARRLHQELLARAQAGSGGPNA